MSDEGKRSELLCTKATERMALDVLREAAKHDRSVSEWLFLVIRRELYGCVNPGQSTNVDKVDQ